MNSDTDRCTFQVVQSEDGEYVGTALEIPTLAHHAATAQEALAGIQQLVAQVLKDSGADEDDLYSRTEDIYPVACLVCGQTLEASPANLMQPSGGVTIHIVGIDAVKMFDPMNDATWLQAALCDNCLRSAISEDRILFGWRPRATSPPPVYRIATSEDTIGFLDNPYLI